MPTFPDVLARRLRHEPGRPFVTFYDGATGERTELSLTSWANWVAKASSLLVDELGLERGQRLRIDLPTHWLGTVLLGAAWNTGLVPADDDAPDVVVCGPGTLATWADRADGGTGVVVLASALDPLGRRFPDGVPPGVHDLGAEIWSQPDAFTPWDPPTADDPAHAFAAASDAAPAGPMTQGELWDAAAAGDVVPDGGRVLSEVNPASPPGLALLAQPLTNNGSLVLLVRPGRGPDGTGADVESVAAAERTTARFPG